jgi:hypothetical protein
MAKQIAEAAMSTKAYRVVKIRKGKQSGREDEALRANDRETSESEEFSLGAQD